MIKRVILIVAALLLLASLPAHAGFNEVVNAIESRYHVHHTTIPMFGLVRFAVRVTHYDGVSDLQLATWEHSEHTRLGDAREVVEIVRSLAGEGFTPVVQAWQRDGECSLIYAHPAGNDQVALLIFAHDKSDTTLVRVVVSVEQFQKALDDEKHGKGMFD